MKPDLAPLPVVSPAIAALLNRMAASRWLLPLQVAEGTDPVLDIRFLPRPFVETAYLDIEIAGDFGTASLRVEADFVDFLSDNVLPGWRDEADDSLPVEWRAILALEAFLDGGAFSEVTAVSARSGTGVVREDGPPLGRLSGSAAIGERSFGLSLELSRIDESRVATLLKFQPFERLNGFDPGFCCRLCLPPRPVEMAAYRGLEPGDTLLAGKLVEGRLPILLEVPQTARFSGGLDPATGAIEIFESAGLNETMGSIDEDFEQNIFEAGAVYDNPPLEDPVDNLPVRLDFLLSTRRISLSELRALGPGATLDVNIDLAQPVTILANGAPAARGYLVQIGDHIGVQISHWPGIGQKDDA